ncbi:zinc finger dihydrouridine synthase [Amanita rubescens]|nr:zinc finger dihydrouridine synthase [Amanita rubescens]
MTSVSLPPGTAPIKPEFLISTGPFQPAPDDDAAEDSTSHSHGLTRVEEGDSRSGGRGRRKLTKEERKAQRGANKGRKFGKVRDELNLCWKVAAGNICEFGSECRFIHDIPKYLAAKPADIRIRETNEIADTIPFVTEVQPETNGHLNTRCPIFDETGECRFGFKCRFLGGHASKDTEGNINIIVDEEKKAQTAVSMHEANFVDAEILKMLRTKKYPTPIANAYLQNLRDKDDDSQGQRTAENAVVVTEPEQDEMSAARLTKPLQNVEETIQRRTGSMPSDDGVLDVPLRFAEKKRLHWTGKTYLAPLTTVGNLPFRRLCVDFGADITCGEMGLANSFLAGSKEEWSLVRRYPSEQMFGVQVAGSKPGNLVPTAEVLAKEFGPNIDFVDVNCGCPIDLVFKTGSGSALLDASAKLGKILIGMNKALGEIPVTVKLRTGVKDGRNTAHKLMPRLSTEFGAGCITLHGRTRQQRYSRLADWDYIKECVDAVRAAEKDKDLPPIPIFGGGDCFSSEDYWHRVGTTGVDGVMIGRGALIKPWIFTEIKERREWDISARERLDLIRKYAEYGLNHFGSDTTGVNTTRRYLCEALSFQYRYVPIGLLERLPGHINERAPAFRGRSDLETLLASPNSKDWVKISEWYLGPAPEGWTFTPKHKSNAFDAESQG